mmetsp:Transcript_85308/g.260823  ORF Transcript_85308/g.260823 Transcript_85308/m.260823 type:complete len:330 (+) Transcript_85308:665-1654(+)
MERPGRGRDRSGRVRPVGEHLLGARIAGSSHERVPHPPVPPHSPRLADHPHRLGGRYGLDRGPAIPDVHGGCHHCQCAYHGLRDRHRMGRLGVFRASDAGVLRVRAHRGPEEEWFFLLFAFQPRHVLELVGLHHRHELSGGLVAHSVGQLVLEGDERGHLQPRRAHTSRTVHHIDADAAAHAHPPAGEACEVRKAIVHVGHGRLGGGAGRVLGPGADGLRAVRAGDPGDAADWAQVHVSSRGGHRPFGGGPLGDGPRQHVHALPRHVRRRVGRRGGVHRRVDEEVAPSEVHVRVLHGDQFVDAPLHPNGRREREHDLHDRSAGGGVPPG